MIPLNVRQINQGTLPSELGLPSLTKELANRYLLVAEDIPGDVKRNLSKSVTSVMIEANAFPFTPNLEAGQESLPNDAKFCVHFSVRLQLSKGAETIRLDSIQPEEDIARAGQLENRVAVMRISVKGPMAARVSSRRSTFLKNSAPMPVKDGPTLLRVLDVLVQRSMHRYRLTTNGSGCRFWCQSVVHSMLQEGWLEDVEQNRLCVGNLLVALRSEQRDQEVQRKKKSSNNRARSGYSTYEDLWLPSEDEQPELTGIFFQPGDRFDHPYIWPEEEPEEDEEDEGGEEETASIASTRL